MPACNTSASNAFKLRPSTVPTLSPKKRTIDEADLDWNDIKKFIKRKKSEQQGHTQERKSYKEKIIKLEGRISQLDDANRKLDDELSRTRGRLTRANERSDELERERGHARKKLREVEEQETRLAVLEKELEQVRKLERDYKVQAEESGLRAEATEVELQNLKRGRDTLLGR
ncbi:hypothetical protein LTS18_005507 [Coniosporium uncinatum]|uniref:Uncharacterized protein n=1 Tax=Coniosporium uncinatum TaxID=93489 RepID=A0ACC3DXI1_9PEZI|nr:hypothetical protein LTS18_005507 [Coniosporium uncinatum]